MRLAGLAPGIRVGQIGAQPIPNPFHLALEIFVQGHLPEPRLPAKLQHPQGTVVGTVPEIRVQVAEKPARARLPAPPEVKGDFTKRLEDLRQGGNNVESVNGLHGMTFVYNCAPGGGLAPYEIRIATQAD